MLQNVKARLYEHEMQKDEENQKELNTKTDRLTSN